MDFRDHGLNQCEEVRSVKFPEELKYSPQHQWLRLKTEGIAVVGITDFAQFEMGDIVFVDHPEVGESIERGASFGEVESNKTSSEVFAPCSGKVIAVNALLILAPEHLNSDPYGDGWLVEIQVLDALELDDLLDSTQYRQLVAG